MSVTREAAPTGELSALLTAVTGLREQVAASALPLSLPGAAAADVTRTQLLNQLDD